MFDLSEDQKLKQIRPTVDTGLGLTKQDMRDETDINLIMKRYRKTGYLNFRNQSEGFFADVENMDLQTALSQVERANEMFSVLPAEARQKFDNSPATFVAFAQDPANAQALVDMGLATLPPGSPPAPVNGGIEETPPVEEPPPA